MTNSLTTQQSNKFTEEISHQLDLFETENSNSMKLATLNINETYLEIDYQQKLFDNSLDGEDSEGLDDSQDDVQFVKNKFLKYQYLGGTHWDHKYIIPLFEIESITPVDDCLYIQRTVSYYSLMMLTF